MKPDDSDLETESLVDEAEGAAGAGPSVEALRTRAGRSYWRAAKAGFRRVSYVSAPISAGFVILYLPSLADVGPADLRFHGSLGAMAILLAAERHRRKTGDWPVSIAAIDPEILAKPPLDPYSGKPFLLERRDGQFVVHSTAPMASTITARTSRSSG